MGAPSCIPKMPIYYETFTNRNFNTNPLTIDDLDGDAYDYTLMVFGLGVSDADVDLSLQFNSDTGSNYRRYRMIGSGSGASASAGESEDSIVLNEMRRSAYPTLAIIKITGDSSDERYVDVLSSGTTNSNTRIGKYSFYWKDTLDNLDEITVRGEFSGVSDATIVLFATPKGVNTENWELVEEKSWSSSSSDQTFSNLDGNAHKEYLLELEEDTGALWWRINNDSLTNYTRQMLYNQNGVDTAVNSIVNRGLFEGSLSKLLIHAETGKKRLAISSSSNKGASRDQAEQAVWYDDTSTNMTSLVLTNLSSSTGKARLYKKKNPNTVADRFNLPFKMIKEVAVSGDFSAGHTFSGLEGDKVLMYKLEWLGDGNIFELRTQFNGDTGSNYTKQHLRGIGSSVSAGSVPANSYILLSDAPAQGYSELYIYPKSGENRPCLSKFARNENNIQFESSWWNDSSSEISSIKVFSANSATMTGTLRLSYIPLPE